MFRNAPPLDVVRTLEIVSNIDQDLVDAGGDVVAFNLPRRAVFAVDTTQIPTRLMAAIGRPLDRPVLTDSVVATDVVAESAIFGFARLGWDVDLLGSQSTAFPMDKGVGPVGPGNTAMSIGFDFNTVPLGGTERMVFRYLFLLGAANLPADFAFPEITAATLSPVGLVLAIILLAAAGLTAIWRYRLR